MPKRTTVRLTKRIVDAAKPDSNEWDCDVRGFGLRVTLNGAKSFIFQFRTLTREQGCVTIGHPPSMTVDQARTIAEELRVVVAKGGNPSRQRQEQRHAATLSDLAKYYCDEYGPARGLKESTIRDARYLLDKFLVPECGNRKTFDFQIGDVRKLHGHVRDEAGRYQANRLLAVLSRMFSLAQEQRWRPDNPCMGVDKFPEDVRRVYFTGDDLPRLLAACDRYPNQNAANAIRLLLFTGARLQEALKADWSQFDLERGTWTKPSAHTKTKRVHVVHLPAAVLEFLRDMRKADPRGKYLFPGLDPDDPRYDLKRPWRAILKDAGLEGFRAHDMRRTMASFLIAGTNDYAKAGKVLGHTQVATTARYAQIVDASQSQAINDAVDAMRALKAKRSRTKAPATAGRHAIPKKRTRQKRPVEHRDAT